MARAMKELYKAQEIDHKHLKRLEHHMLLLAKATKTAFVHINGKLAMLDVKIGHVMSNLKCTNIMLNQWLPFLTRMINYWSIFLYCRI